MSFRIQPRDIDVPKDDPFSNDLLGRKEPIEALTRLVGSLEGPCVIAVDAPWGTGKTTFFRMWGQHLRNEDFLVADFNAWETDFSGDPLLALSTELLRSLEESADEAWRADVREIMEKVPDLLMAAASTIVSTATHGLVDVKSLLEPTERVRRYGEAVQRFRGFREDLQDVANSASESRSGKPLIILIDELDRCRPPYAVELLEVAKHLFASRHVVFALALNRAELEHSVQTLYGDGFDAHGYLRRFFDIDCRLPDPDRGLFIDNMLDVSGIGDTLQRVTEQEVRLHAPTVRSMLHGFFSLPHLSLRRVGQAIHRLGLVYASLSQEHPALLLYSSVALILRTLDADLYHGLVTKRASGDEALESLSAGRHGSSYSQASERDLFEAVILASDDPHNSELLREYEAMLGGAEHRRGDGATTREHATSVVQLAQRMGAWKDIQSGFAAAVERIELFSETLDPTPATEFDSA